MKRAKPATIILDIAIGLGVGLLFGIIPGIAAFAVALMWTVPSQMTRRTKIILTVAVAVLVIAMPVTYYLSAN